METSTEKIIRLFLIYPRKTWKQSELAKKVGCSKAFVSKLIKRLVSEGVITRPNPQKIILINNAKLLNKWYSLRKMPKPIYIKTEFSKRQIENMLKKETDYCLTLFSAAWHRIKFMKTNRIEAYVNKRKTRKFIEKFGKISKNPTNFIIFPSDNQLFEATEKVNGLHLVHFIQNYVDLVSLGGTGIRVAHELDKKYDLRGI